MRLLRLPGVFPPHSDSWLLASHVAREAIRPNAAVLDLCTGSGLLALSAAGKPGASVVAVDVSRRAVITARLNARLNGRHLRVLRGDLFAPVRGQSFDLIVTNPPYLPGTARAPRHHSRARAWEGGPSGRAFLDRICRDAPGQLRPDGVLLLVQSSVSGEDETLRALTAGGLEAAVIDRRSGPLGPLLSARAASLRAHGLLDDDGSEELIVIRARRPASEESTTDTLQPRNNQMDRLPETFSGRFAP